MQVIDKAAGNPDQVEVETSQLIFKVFSINHTDLQLDFSMSLLYFVPQENP